MNELIIIPANILEDQLLRAEMHAPNSYVKVPTLSEYNNIWI